MVQDPWCTSHHSRSPLGHFEPHDHLTSDLQRLSNSTLLGSGEGGGEPVEGDGLAAEGAGAEDESTICSSCRTW